MNLYKHIYYSYEVNIVLYIAYNIEIKKNGSTLMTENIQDDLKNWLATAKSTKPKRKAKSNKLDKIFGSAKKDVLELFTVYGYSIAQVHNDLTEKNIIKDIPYRTFHSWVKKNLEIGSNSMHVESDNNGNVVEEEYIQINEGNSINASHEFQQDSREIFYGFDMNNEPDPVANPLPKIYEITKDYIFNIFTNDTTLNNEKIVYILLYEISSSGENIQQYYNRLQDVIDSDRNYSFGITNATASISDIAYACGCDRYKILGTV